MTALLAASLWAWSPGLKGPYLFDDNTTPNGDPASQSLSDWRHHLPVTLRPLTKLTYALEADFGLTAAPGARRGVSILLQGFSAGLLMLLIVRLAPAVTPLGAALGAALWFGHPVHADSVLLVSGRTAVLANAFVLAALVALRGSRQWWAALLFVLACLSRETALAAVLPLGVLTASRYRGRWRAGLREFAPILAAAVIVLGWILTTPRYLHLAEYSLLGRPFWASLVSQVGAVPVGIGLLLNPAALSIDYGIPLPTRASDPLFLLGLLLYFGAAAGMLMTYRRQPAVAVGLALWLAALLPTQSIVPKLDALANRPLSLALAGLLLAVAPLAGTVVSRVQWRAVTTASAGVALFVWLAVATSSRATLFQSELAVWQDAAAKSRVNERPHVQYAVLLRLEGRNREALEELRIAERINPFSSQIATMSRLFASQETSR